MATRVLLALLAGLVLGILASSSGNETLLALATGIEPIGTLFINGIRMTVIPLVVGSLIAGIAAAPSAASLGRLGMRAFVLFLVTLFGAGLLGAVVAPPVLALIPIDPAASAALQAAAAGSASTTQQSVQQIPGFAQWLISLVPANPVRAAADGAMLPLIVFTLAFGLAVTQLRGETRQTVAQLFQAIRDASLTLVQWVLWLAPVGVFALSMPLAARLGLSAAGALAGYIGLIAALTIIVGVVVLYPMASIMGRVPVMEFARAALPAQAVAFSSRSSLASLPAAIEAARDVLKLPEEAPSFLLPLAASVYRIGASLGQTVGVVFVARLYGVDLDPTALASVVLASVATSFSVPGIPGGSIVIMAPVLQAAGVPIEGIGILLGVDTIPDMFRTTVNVTGHLASATAVVGGRKELRAES